MQEASDGHRKEEEPRDKDVEVGVEGVGGEGAVLLAVAMAAEATGAPGGAAVVCAERQSMS